MKIHALCLIKNEADVIEECLRAAAQWCDHVYVWDNGSTDGTWEIASRIAAELPQIVAWRRKTTETFSDGLRREIFEEFRDRASMNDWWCRLDADEFYAQDPRLFLRTLPASYDVVWYASLSYYLSSDAAELYERDPSRFADDVPVAERCRYYFNHWSEPRFVRHSLMSESWPADAGWPPAVHAARTCPIRILCRHYAYRSPAQIEARIATRAKSALSGKVFSHEAIKNWAQIVDPEAVKHHRWRDIAYTTDAKTHETGWRSRVIPAGSLHYDAHDGRYEVNEMLMPPLPMGSTTLSAKDLMRLCLRKIGFYGIMTIHPKMKLQG